MACMSTRRSSVGVGVLNGMYARYSYSDEPRNIIKLAADYASKSVKE